MGGNPFENSIESLRQDADTTKVVDTKHRRPRHHTDRFVVVPLRWAENAARATGTPKAFVWVWLLHLAWKAKSNTFPLPNGLLQERGVSRLAKYRALRELEAARLIRVSRENRKTPVVTLLNQ